MAVERRAVAAAVAVERRVVAAAVAAGRWAAVAAVVKMPQSLRWRRFCVEAELVDFFKQEELLELDC